mmetsp:Transcript_16514/g.36097  ORF Transcript_16514/g.36097 Transcript_16514/m.36097 type:complete len:256 (+) Transcript_16514:377-1144(+)
MPTTGPFLAPRFRGFFLSSTASLTSSGPAAAFLAASSASRMALIAACSAARFLSDSARLSLSARLPPEPHATPPELGTGTGAALATGAGAGMGAGAATTGASSSVAETGTSLTAGGLETARGIISLGLSPGPPPLPAAKGAPRPLPSPPLPAPPLPGPLPAMPLIGAGVVLRALPEVTHSSVTGWLGASQMFSKMPTIASRFWPAFLIISRRALSSSDWGAIWRYVSKALPPPPPPPPLFPPPLPRAAISVLGMR